MKITRIIYIIIFSTLSNTIDAQQKSDEIIHSFLNWAISEENVYVVNEFLNWDDFINNSDCLSNELINYNCSKKKNVESELINFYIVSNKFSLISKQQQKSLEKYNKTIATQRMSLFESVEDLPNLCLAQIIELSNLFLIAENTYLLAINAGFYESNYSYDFYIIKYNTNNQIEYIKLPCSGGS
jgi:hypothetical protein